MSRLLPHPTREQIELPLVLDCLSDPTRLAIVYLLSRRTYEVRCSVFYALSSKSNLTYHFAKLREGGLILTRAVGTNRLIALRRDDLDARFPGLLDAVLASATRDAVRLDLPEGALAAAD